MALNRCANGHYFDPAQYVGCPTCAGGSARGAAPAAAFDPAPAAHPGPTGTATSTPAAAAGWTTDDGQTRRRDESAAHRPPAAALPPAWSSSPPMAGATPIAGAAPDAGRTERLVHRQTGIDPVVGWLVCVAGPDRGADYRLHGERNFIGRGETMDVRLAGDRTVSRENHVSLSHDPKKESFRLLPGEGRGIVYLNGEELVGPSLLAAGDRIELGETTLLFVPLCGNGFRWEATPPAGG